MINITVYTKEGGCPQCTAATKFLDSVGANYAEKPIDTDVMAMARVLGIKQAPIVTAANPEANVTVTHAGFDKELLDQLAHEQKYVNSLPES